MTKIRKKQVLPKSGLFAQKSRDRMLEYFGTPSEKMQNAKKYKCAKFGASIISVTLQLLSHPTKMFDFLATSRSDRPTLHLKN